MDVRTCSDRVIVTSRLTNIILYPFVLFARVQVTNAVILVDRCTVCGRRNGVGLFGSKNTIFYARVTDDMKVSDGGGVAAEGEFIETVEVPVSQTLDFIRDNTVQRPTGMLFALMWFHVYKAAKETAS